MQHRHLISCSLLALGLSTATLACGTNEGGEAPGADSTGAGDFSAAPDSLVLLEGVHVLGAYPAIKGTSVDPTKVWRRACGGQTPDGYLLNLGFLTTSRGGTGDALDQDRGLHPGDRIGGSHRLVLDCVADPLACSEVEDGVLLEPSTLSLDMGCYEEFEPGGGLDGACGGVTAEASLVQISHKAHLAPSPLKTLAESAHSLGHNVVFLVDYSGSMSGMVDADTLQEDPDPFLVQGFANFASDPYNNRLGALMGLIDGQLNPNDRIGVVAFGENITYSGLQVPCAEADGTAALDLATCFGTDHAQWLDADTGIPSIAPGGGRSNLWEAVDLAYDFLKDSANGHEPGSRANHIVVITDGPDTAAYSEELGVCQSAVTQIDAGDILKEIAEEDVKAGGVDVAIHFVQFEAQAYLGPDVRQQEVACASGGHHRFIDSQAFSPEGKVLSDTLSQALGAIRHAWTGSWQIPVEDGAFSGADALHPGHLYALSGSLTFGAEACVSESGDVCQELVVPMGAGQGHGVPDGSGWDVRPLVRSPCTLGADCGGTEAVEGSCHQVCSPETGLCPGGALGYDLRDGAPCFDGGPGSCCGGACVVGFCEGCL